MSDTNLDPGYVKLNNSSFLVYDEQDNNDDLSVDLTNVPSSSQEALQEIFGP